MDRKFQETQLDVKKGNTKWIDAIEQIKGYQVFKTMEKLNMKRERYLMHPRDIRRLDYMLCLMSSIVENSKQGLWLMDILPRNKIILSIQELFH